MRYICVCILSAFMIFPSLAVAQEYNTVEELAAAFSSETCKECHRQIYEEWMATPHADSINLAIGGLRNYQVFGVNEWWGRKVTKAELMKCLDCHAPLVNYASEKLTKDIGDMIITAQEKGDKKVMKELSKLNVGCVACHNIKATTVAIGRLGEPQKGAVYGVHGKKSPAHETIKSSELTRAVFCMQCHGTWTAPDGEIIQCNTLSGSYQDSYLSRGGASTCQDCHMLKNNRGHKMLGGRDLEMVKSGIGFNVEFARYLHLPGKGEELWTPSAIVTVELENRSGHRIPDG